MVICAFVHYKTDCADRLYTIGFIFSLKLKLLYCLYLITKEDCGNYEQNANCSIENAAVGAPQPLYYKFCIAGGEEPIPVQYCCKKGCNARNDKYCLYYVVQYHCLFAVLHPALCLQFHLHAVAGDECKPHILVYHIAYNVHIFYGCYLFVVGNRHGEE